jgi:NAD(P)-dependent dehydrogenase (short-subunit alcohol dehydrogenase family)
MYAKDLLKGKTAVVTGGGTGIGKEVARQLALHGACVVIASRDAERLEAAAQELSKETGGKVVAVPVDVAEMDSVKALFDAAEAKAGPVGIIINGAAANFVRPSEMLTSVRFKKVVDIVLHGAFNMCIEGGKRMLPRGEGVIVNLLASYAWTGAAGFLPSAAAKGGVLALTKTLGVEWAPRGVRVNAMCPGLVDTPQSRERLWPEEWMREDLLSQVPSGRFGTEKEMAEAVLYLCAPGSRYAAGEVLTLDGGASTGGAFYLNFLKKAGAIRRKKTS